MGAQGRAKGCSGQTLHTTDKKKCALVLKGTRDTTRLQGCEAARKLQESCQQAHRMHEASSNKHNTSNKQAVTRSCLEDRTPAEVWHQPQLIGSL
jgi:hypothetical protein